MTTEELPPDREILGQVLGHNIRRLRTEAGLTQRAFTDLIQAKGMTAWSAARVSNAETANQPLNTVHELLSIQRILSEQLGRKVELDEFLEPEPVEEQPAS